MPKSDWANNPLEKSRAKRWRDQLRAGVDRLPKGLRPAAFASLGYDPEGRAIEGSEQRADARLAAAGLLDDCTARARLQVFETLLPELARHVEAAWQLGQRTPYQRGDEGRVFRAPNSPAVSQKARGDWLAALVELLGGQRHGITWVAARAPEIDGFAEGDVLAVLFAAAIDAGDREGKKVFDILGDVLREGQKKESVRPHAVRALLLASRPDGWERVEKMLLSLAGPEEGRRIILESASEAHPEAFRRMLRLVQEHDLARSPEIVQVLNGWLGYAWSAVSPRLVNGVLARVVEFLDSAARTKALKSDDAETVYLALWTLAFDDAVATVKPAAKLAKDANVDRRFAAVHLLGQLDLPEARKPLRAALDDKDLRVALRALEGFGPDLDEENSGRRGGADLFEPLERLLDRMPPKRTALAPIIWPWHVLIADAQEVAADLIGHLGRRPATRLLAHVSRMDIDRRAQVVRKAAGVKRER